MVDEKMNGLEYLRKMLLEGSDSTKALLQEFAEALLAAREILRPLKPDTTTDAETLGLWGAIHKRLWELQQDRAALDEGIRAYEKGFIVKNDHYNGINYAFMLNMRAAASTGREAVADAVTAERVRRRVVPLCQAMLAKAIVDEDGKVDAEETFWVQASLLEALVGSGQAEQAAALDAKLRSSAPEAWMVETMDNQLNALRAMLPSG